MPTMIPTEPTPPTTPPSSDTAVVVKSSPFDWVKRHWQIVAIVGVIVVAAAAGGVWYKLRPTKPVTKTPVKTTVAPPPPPPKPTTKASPLTGVQVDPAVADRPVRAVVIENHPDARPQSGLGQAGVVYEALAEGGITRFLAFYLENRPAFLGPVRSVRTYFVSWTLEFNAPVAHAGGNMDALDLIAPLNMKNMDEFYYGSSFFRSNDRYAPHNLYTTSDLLDQLGQKLGYNQPASFTPSPRKADSAPPSSGGINTIDINYSYNGYQVEYRFDSAANNYLRFLAGAPAVDRNDNSQIRVKNIVVEFMPTAYGVTRIGEQTVRMGDSGMPIGSNKALVFRDGIGIQATWNKASNTARTKLLDNNGAEIPLDAGNTWYSIVPVGNAVTYK